jgi:Tol biopolymer transport system component
LHPLLLRYYDQPVPRPRWVLALVALAAFLVLPAVAQATLVFVRKPLKPQVWVAGDSGKHAQRLVAGTNPRVSPDGRTVAFSPLANGSPGSGLALAPSDGSAPVKRLLGNWREPYVFAWSPDSSTIAALIGPEIGPRRLVSIDVASGSQHTIAKGYFSGVSFAPEGGQLVYARSGSERYPPRSDVYRAEVPIPGATYVHAPRSFRLTHDQRSTSPVWGPTDRIAFVKSLGAKKRKYGPKNELYLMNPNGSHVRRLTHTEVSPLAQGLTPTQWSPDGQRLLAQFGGQDLTYAVAVNPRNGTQRPLVEATEQGFLAWGFTANGKRVLGASGGGDPSAGHDVETVPYHGGKAKVLARNAFEPSWGG